MANSLKQMLLKKQSKDKEIKEFELDVEKYLNQEDIYNIIKGSIKNNFRFMRYYKDFQINFVPIQYWGFSGRDDSYEVTIQAKGTTEEAPKYLKSFIREKKILILLWICNLWIRWNQYYKRRNFYFS